MSPVAEQAGMTRRPTEASCSASRSPTTRRRPRSSRPVQCGSPQEMVRLRASVLRSPSGQGQSEQQDSPGGGAAGSEIDRNSSMLGLDTHWRVKSNTPPSGLVWRRWH